jgi:hypothetical protein
MIIPERYRSTCEFCQHELDTRALGVHQFTTGWVKNRAGGGGHAVSLPTRENRWAHGHCIDRLAAGRFSQEELFGTSAKPAAAPAKPLPETNARLDKEGRLIHKCCAVCWSPDAPFGDGVAVKDGVLGMWYCKEHWTPSTP